MTITANLDIDTRPPARLGSYCLVLPCFIALNAMCGWQFDVTVFLVWGLLLGGFSLLLLVLLLAWFNPQVRIHHGYLGIAGTVGQGLLLLVPFTLLAAFAQFGLGWNDPLAFLASGLLASAAAIGGEMVKIGGGRIVCGLLPIMWSVFSLLAWMLLSIELTGVAG